MFYNIGLWCPIENDTFPLGTSRALIDGTENFTVFVKNSITFPFSGENYYRNNLVGNNGTPCDYEENLLTGENNGCQIFRLEDIISKAKGNFSR
jgi:hypothetical protein